MSNETSGMISGINLTIVNFSERFLVWTDLLYSHLPTDDYIQLEVIDIIPKIRSISRALG